MALKELVSKLTWVDYLVLAASLRGIYIGYKTGLFPELLRIAAYAVTAVVTLRFHGELAQLLTLKTFLNESTATAAAFAALLAVAFLVTRLVSLLLLKLLKVGGGSWIYRALGSLVGVCRWMVLLSLLFMLIDRLPMESLKTDIHQRSVTGPKVSLAAPTLFEFLSMVKR